MAKDLRGDFEIVGLVNHRQAAVGAAPSDLDFDPDYIRTSALSQEAAGYDRVLIANAATMPESFAIGSYLSSVTTDLGFMMAHRPGFVPPTMALMTVKCRRTEPLTPKINAITSRQNMSK